jgi:hypothetical protein
VACLHLHSGTFVENERHPFGATFAKPEKFQAAQGLPDSAILAHRAASIKSG